MQIKWKVVGLIMCFMFLANTVSAREHVVTIFDLSDAQRLELSKKLSVDHGEQAWGTLRVYVNDLQLIDLRLQGYHIVTMPHPGLKNPKMGMLTQKGAAPDWTAYPTYAEYVQMMQDFATDYPDLVRLIDLGNTQDGHKIWVLKISDNPDVDEDEPEVLYTSTMHGDETTGYPMLLHFVWDMLNGYGSDPVMTGLVNDMEIWINPLANPDGTYAGGDHTVSGSQRSLSNGWDPNRNFPDPRVGDHADGHPYAVETQAMMAFAEAHHFIVAANFHGGAEVFNYPWDTWCSQNVGGCGVLKSHADDSWYQSIGHVYADQVQADGPTGYMTGFDNGITNGGNWYVVAGGRQDYMNYWRHTHEVTIELSNTKTLPAASLPAYYLANKQALIDFIRQSLTGVRGVVKNVGNQPLDAIVKLMSIEHDGSEAITDPMVGDYHRVALPGTYTVEVSAPGYFTQTFNDVVVNSGAATRLDVVLQNATEMILEDGFE